jgi:tRNA uridine 5-carbamoylmethylation protein Kti12
MDAIRPCVVCLSGLPGAGKTSLARRIALDPAPLRAALGLADDRPLHVHHICYDALMREQLAQTGASAAFEVEAWRAARREAVQRARSALVAASEPAASATVTVVLLDDNMHYRSMRKAACHLAREHGAAFVHVHVRVSETVALARNAARAENERVPAHLLHEMAAAFEPPLAGARGWERTVIAIDNDAPIARTASWTEALAPAALAREWLERRVNEGELAAEEDARDASRRETLSSALHQLDLRCRATIAQRVAAEPDATASEKWTLAARLNVARKRALALARAAAPAPTAGQGHYFSATTDLLLDEEHAAFARECGELSLALRSAALCMAGHPATTSEQGIRSLPNS